jgi:hypothetical protein
MGTTDPDAHESIRSEHGSIRKTLGQIERTVADYPGPGAEPAWLGGIRERLDELHTLLRDHFRYEERSGMFDDIRDHLPATSDECRSLLGDHDRLLRRLEEIRGDAARRSETGASAGGLGERVLEWIRDLSDHENRENELLLDAIEGGPQAQD